MPHETRLCPRCNTNNTGIHSGHCNRCRYEVRYAINRAIVAEAKDRPCHDCGLYETAIMDFDHVPERGPKHFTIGNSLGGTTTQKVIAEITQCDVVCPNCHRRRTIARRGAA